MTDMEKEKPPLLALAAELRNQIYDLVVPSHNGYIMLGMTSGNETDEEKAISPPPPRGALAMSQTCQQLRQETLPMLFSCNTFFFRVEYYLNDDELVAGSKHNGIGTHTKNTTDVKFMLEGLRNWLDSVQEDSTRHMRDVCIWLGRVNMKSEDPGAVDKSLEFLYDTWTELQQHVSRLGLSGTRAARFGLHFRLKIDLRYRGSKLFDISLHDRSEGRRGAQRAVVSDRADLLRSQNEQLAAMGEPPRSALISEFETTMVIQEGIVHVLFD
ncbi:hypothetical protein LTR56_025117 [Elasticomyces elasticus]|nr:hypothetical protein LTR56_025117 [Elasticomyces elasticus]KAK3635853.1 hypothetical protein LTR22_018988 [Elasticomyces elasticus]KAK4919802.1 hypothetical protein LTR49_012549 [Elasticomyces elasticus]KAK5741139.1 hypothetical protein LTS12_024693 [Elasticomyces elasticus]